MQRPVEREGQGIRRVIGFGNFFQAQEMQEHPLHVILRGASIARDGELQLEGGGLENGASQLRRRRDDDSPCMRHIHGAPNVARKEELFDDNDVGLRLAEECCDILGDLREAIGERHGFCSDCEPFCCANTRRGCHFHSTEADRGDAGVDAENTHGVRL